MRHNDGGRKSSRVRKTAVLFISGIFAGIFMAGCGSAENRSGKTMIDHAERQTAEEAMEEPAGERAAEPEKVPEAAPGLSAEETDAYEQMALYIQEGFRVYGIEGAYQAYFGPIEEEEKSFFFLYSMGWHF